MFFDGITLYAVKEELIQHLINGRIVKIFHPSDYVLKFIIVNDNKLHTLLISTDPDWGACTLSNSKNINPPSPSNFCKFLRIHLINSIITKIEQINFDRILHISLSSREEKDFKKLLIIEFMGKYSNLILVNQANNRILESQKHVDKGKSSLRNIYPGQLYIPPPVQNKLVPLHINKEDFYQIMSTSEPGYKSLINNFSGISTHAAKRIYSDDLDMTWKNFNHLFGSLTSNSFSPEIIIDNEHNRIISISPVSINSPLYLFDKIQFSSICECIDHFISLQKNTFLDNEKTKLTKIIDKIIIKLNNRIKNLKKTLIKHDEIKQYELYGKLILANIYNISKGKEEVILPNVYTENAEPVKIKLNPAISPSKNAEIYFKKYHKHYDNFKILKNKLDMTSDEIYYFNKVIKEIISADSLDLFNNIKAMLIDQGYIHPDKKSKKKKKDTSTNIKKYKSSDGFEILVGTNDKENEYITMRLARPNDLWLHVKDSAGAHVIVKNKTQCNDLPVRTIEEASILAAFFSQAKHSSNVPVSYTYKKFVKKPKGAPKGNVIYKNHKTIYITPQIKIVEKIKNYS